MTAKPHPDWLDTDTTAIAAALESNRQAGRLLDEATARLRVEADAHARLRESFASLEKEAVASRERTRMLESVLAAACDMFAAEDGPRDVVVRAIDGLRKAVEAAKQ